MITIRGLTIDDASTRDIDDAIWVTETPTEWHATISIADVAGHVMDGSPHDLRAREMVETKYFATGNSPMLQTSLSEDKLSLWPGKKRDVIAVSVVIDKETLTPGYMGASRAELTSLAKLSYRDVPSILADASNLHHAMMTSAASLSRALLNKRRSDGAFVLYDLNNGWVTTEEGFLRHIESHEATVGYIVVQELMILANAAIARWAVNCEVPILFRNHEARLAAPDRAGLQRQLDSALTAPIQGLDSLRERTHLLLDRAVYGSSVLGHYGLNLPVYTHFTSPIRRYADLVNHRQIRGALSGIVPYSKERITAFAEHINSVLKSEDTARSKAMKEKHERRAVRAIDARRLDGLPHKEFERVTKIEARSGADPSAAFADAFTLRTRERKTSLLAMAVVLTQAPVSDAWRPIRAVIVEALAHRPEDAVSVLAQAPQIDERWTAPKYKLIEATLNGTPAFRVEASVCIGGETETGACTSHQKKRAEQRAAVRLLANLFGVPVPDSVSAAVVPPAPAVPALSPTKDPISTLQEWGQTNGAIPDYEFEMSGPSHTPVVTCTCRVGTRSVRAEAGNKMSAKRAAAVEMILKIAMEKR